MSEKLLSNVRMKIKRDSAANWAVHNPILMSGEKGIEYDTLKMKVGDGIKHWNELGYCNVTPSDLSNLIFNTSVMPIITLYLYTATGTDGTMSETLPSTALNLSTSITNTWAKTNTITTTFTTPSIAATTSLWQLTFRMANLSPSTTYYVGGKMYLTLVSQSNTVYQLSEITESDAVTFSTAHGATTGSVTLNFNRNFLTSNVNYYANDYFTIELYFKKSGGGTVAATITSTLTAPLVFTRNGGQITSAYVFDTNIVDTQTQSYRNRSYESSIASIQNSFLPLAGGTVTGDLTVNGNITNVLPKINTFHGFKENPNIYDLSVINCVSTNNIRFFPPQLQEQSTDNITWTTSTRATSTQLSNLVVGASSVGTDITAIPISNIGDNGYYRLTWNYDNLSFLQYFLFLNCNANSNNINILIEKYSVDSSTWVQVATGIINDGLYFATCKHDTISFGNSSGQYSKMRVTFYIIGATVASSFHLQKMEWWGYYASGNRNVYTVDSSKNITLPNKLIAQQIESQIATGTSPFIVNSTTAVTNLNSDYLDGQHGSYYNTAGNLTGTIPSSVLGNSSLYIGTTSIALNRSSSALTLNSVDIDGQARKLECVDTRNDTLVPSQYTGKGLWSNFFLNSKVGLSDGGTYTGVWTYKKWSDFSGGKPVQLAFTDNENLWIRFAASDIAWGTWKKFIATTQTISLPGFDGTIMVLVSSVPASKTATGTKGMFAYDDDFLYICTDTNIWKRIALAADW